MVQGGRALDAPQSIRVRLARWLAGGAMVLLSAAVAAADPTFTFVDLQPKANHKLADDLHPDSEGNHLGAVPQGEQKLGDVRFKIGEKLIHLRGAHVPDLPEKVEGIKVDATFDRLHVLHSTGYGEGSDPPLEDGTEIGAYVLRYADGTSAKMMIRYGEDLRDWWDWPDRTELKRARVAWLGTNPAAEGNGRKVRLFSVVWDNPHPTKPVATIDFLSNNTECDPFLVALTLEKK